MGERGSGGIGEWENEGMGEGGMGEWWNGDYTVLTLLVSRNVIRTPLTITRAIHLTLFVY